MGHLSMRQKEAPRPGRLRAEEHGRISNAEGARAAGLSVRQFRRLRAVYRAEGVEGLMHGNRGRPSARRLSDEQRQRVVDLINQKYAGFNDCHLTEKLRTVEKIVLSRALVRRIRHEAGLPAKRKRRAPKHRKRRDREAREGALVLIDGHWSVEEQLAGRQRPTQFGQLLEDLGIAFIAAHSPQAKGRVERMWETLQDRLISELRLLGLTTPEQVEAYLPQFIAEFNARFAVAARERDAAWRSAPRNIERLLACRYTRKVARDNTASLPGRWIQLPPRAHGRSWQGCKVEVRECLDGTALVLHRGEVVARQAPPATPFTLVYREGGHGRRRCPENFTPAPPPAPTPPPRSARRNRRGQLTNIRPPARKHPWRRGYKSPSPAPA
jgi:transposase